MELSNIVVAPFYIIKVNLFDVYAVSSLKIAKIKYFLAFSRNILSIQ